MFNCSSIAVQCSLLLEPIYFSGRKNCISHHHKILFPAGRETILLSSRTGETRMAANNPLVRHSLQPPRCYRPIREQEKREQPMGRLTLLHHQLPDTLLWFVRAQLEADIYIRLICGLATLNCLCWTIWVMSWTKEKSLPITLFAFSICSEKAPLSGGLQSVGESIKHFA